MTLLDGMTRGLHWASLAILVGLVVLINMDIFARNLFSRPLVGVPELMGQAIVIFAFFQLPNSFAKGKVLRNDRLLRRLKKTTPSVATTLNIAFHVAAFAILIPLITQSIPMLIKDWASQDFVGAVGVFTWPIWPTRCAILIGAVVLMGQILRSALQDLR